MLNGPVRSFARKRENEFLRCCKSDKNQSFANGYGEFFVTKFSLAHSNKSSHVEKLEVVP